MKTITVYTYLNTLYRLSLKLYSILKQFRIFYRDMRLRNYRESPEWSTNIARGGIRTQTGIRLVFSSNR